MPFISSVSGSKGGLIWPLGTPVLVPTITINTTTNYNQTLATFNATVNPNGGTTSVKFQYKKSADATWNDGQTITGLTGVSQSVYSNQTGLDGYGTAGGNYDVRAVATNSAGSATSSTTTFTTWRLIEWTSTSLGSNYSGTTSFTVPTVTPTGGSTVIPTIYEVFILGGGQGCWGTGGAGGGYRLVSSRSFSSTSNTTLSLTVGAGGAGGGTAGGTTQITASNFTSIDAGGGQFTDSRTVGYGDNPAYVGGNVASWTNGGKNDPTYLGYGGGPGISGNGANGEAGNAYGYGGAGGAGGTAYGYNGGAGGYGYGTTSHYGNGSYHGYGSGGYGTAFSGTAGTSGLIRFRYYGA